MSATILSRMSDLPSSSSDSPTPFQNQVDEGVFTALKNQLTDPYLIASEVVGAGVYSLVRIPALRYARPVVITRRSSQRFGLVATIVVRSTPRLAFIQEASLYGGALAGAEAFEFSHRGLLQLGGKGAENPNLWKWKGDGGLKSGLLKAIPTMGIGLFIGSGVGEVMSLKRYPLGLSILAGVAAGETYFQGSRFLLSRLHSSPEKTKKPSVDSKEEVPQTN